MSTNRQVRFSFLFQIKFPCFFQISNVNSLVDNHILNREIKEFALKKMVESNFVARNSCMYIIRKRYCTLLKMFILFMWKMLSSSSIYEMF
jgi:hypothetical protein